MNDRASLLLSTINNVDSNIIFTTLDIPQRAAAVQSDTITGSCCLCNIHCKFI